MGQEKLSRNPQSSFSPRRNLVDHVNIETLKPMSHMIGMKKPKLIHHFIEQSASNFPQKIALIHEKVRATFSELNLKANRLARFLSSSGLRKGDRVVLMYENSLNYVVSYYAALKAGGVIVSLSTELKPHGLQPLLQELNPRFAIVSSRLATTILGCDLQSSSLKCIIIPAFDKSVHCPVPLTSLDDILSGSDSCSDPDMGIEDTDLAAIIYTSGSTGKPKGAVLTHRNIVANALSICEYLELTEGDTQMVVLPFFYVMGKSLLNTHFAVGGSVVINNKFAYPATVVRQMIEERVSGFSGVPSTFAYLLHRSPLSTSRGDLSALRYVSQAGGHMSKSTKLALRKALPEHTKIFIMYGATEASARLTYLDPLRFHDKMDSIGRPIPDVQVRILDTEGRELPARQEGEIVARGPNIMAGYWRDELATRRVLDGNGYHTGDQGYKDEEGFIFVTGRRDHQLKVGGHRVDPQEIEDVIMESQQVVEVAVGGLPDKLLGNKLVGVVVPIDDQVSDQALRAFCTEHLPHYKVPSSIRLVRSLPKSPNGKIDKEKCLQLAG